MSSVDNSNWMFDIIALIYSLIIIDENSFTIVHSSQFTIESNRIGLDWIDLFEKKNIEAI